MSASGGPLLVGLPEAVGRRARLGPFPSGEEALKFAAVAGVGAVVADATAPLLWLPFLVAGFALAVVRVDGKGVDARALDYLRWRLRSRGGGSGGRAADAPRPRGAVAPWPGGRLVAILSTGGLPIAFLPRRDAEALFDGFRALLRAHGEGLYLLATVEPIPGGPASGAGPGREDPALRAARDGYDELLGLLRRARGRRRVDVVAWTERQGPDPIGRLEGRVQALYGGLVGLGLEVERLEGEALRAGLARLGGGEGR